MTPDEHYAEAERLLGEWRKASDKLAATTVHGTQVPPGIAAAIREAAGQLLAEAQVHATLATLVRWPPT